VLRSWSFAGPGYWPRGMSLSEMREKPALPTASAKPMRMIIRRAPNQVIVPLVARQAVQPFQRICVRANPPGGIRPLQPLPYPMRLGRYPVAIATMASIITTRMAAVSISTSFSVAKSPHWLALWCRWRCSEVHTWHKAVWLTAWPSPWAALSDGGAEGTPLGAR